MSSRYLSRALLYLGTAASVVTAGVWHANAHGYRYTGTTRFGWSIAYVCLLCAVAYGIGLPDVIRDWRDAIGKGVLTTLTSALGMSVIQLLLGDALLPRSVVFTAAIALLPWYAICSIVASGGRAWAEQRDRVVVVGDAEETSLLTRDLQLDLERPAQLVACLDPEELTTSKDASAALSAAFAEARGTVLVLSRRSQLVEDIVHEAGRLHELGVRVRTLSLFYEEWLGKLPVGELERVSLMFDLRELHRAVYGRAARLLDVTLAAAGTLVLTPLIPIVFVGNLIGNVGPMFYRQARVGRAGTHFTILKFRTMRPRATEEVNEWTTEDDPRITPFGRILRLTHVDELPQVINVLRGDLSIVGPRPEQPHYVEQLVEKVPFYNLRHLVRPGLTGWAQVKYGYAGSERDAVEKLQYDFYYLRHQNLALDIRIIVRTLRSVAGARGR